MEKNKEHDAAFDLCRTALAIRKKVHGEDNLDTGSPYTGSNIGAVYYGKGEFGNVMEYHQKALAIRKAHGEDYLDTAPS